MLIPHSLFPNDTLPKQLYYVVNAQSSLTGVEQTFVLLQMGLLIFTLVKTLFAIVKRDNYSERIMLLLFPCGFFFVVALVQTIILGPFLSVEQFDPAYFLQTLRYPGFGLQLLLISALFLTAAFFYGWMDRKLNQHPLNPLEMILLFGFEGIVALSAIAVGFCMIGKQFDLLSSVPAVLWKWFVYGMCLLVTRIMIYAVAIPFGLLFSSPAAKARLYQKQTLSMADDSPKPRTMTAVQLAAQALEQEFSFGQPEYSGESADTAYDEDADRRICKYIRAKSLPYLVGIYLFVFGAFGIITALELQIYFKKTFYHPGDLYVIPITGIILFGTALLCGTPQHTVSVFAPRSSRFYRAFDSWGNGERLRALFIRELFQKSPVWVVSGIHNLVLTQSYLVMQGPKLRAVYLPAVLSYQQTATPSAGNYLLFTMQGGTQIKIGTPAPQTVHPLVIRLKKLLDYAD